MAGTQPQPVSFTFETKIVGPKTPKEDAAAGGSSIGTTFSDHVGDLTSDPASGTLCGVKINSNQLLKIDPVSGLVASTRNLNSEHDMTSLAFDPVGH